MIWKCTWLLFLLAIRPSLTSLRMITPHTFFVSAPFYHGGPRILRWLDTFWAPFVTTASCKA